MIIWLGKWGTCSKQRIKRDAMAVPMRVIAHPLFVLAVLLNAALVVAHHVQQIAGGGHRVVSKYSTQNEMKKWHAGRLCRLFPFSFSHFQFTDFFLGNPGKHTRTQGQTHAHAQVHTHTRKSLWSRGSKLFSIALRAFIIIHSIFAFARPAALETK